MKAHIRLLVEWYASNSTSIMPHEYSEYVDFRILSHRNSYEYSSTHTRTTSTWRVHVAYLTQQRHISKFSIFYKSYTSLKQT